MKNLSLNAEFRTGDEKLKDIRVSKMIPAIVYGHSQESISIKVDYSEFLKTFRKSGESHIISLKIDGKELEVLVHDVQKRPVSGDYIHIDFYAITKGESVHTHIQLEFVGNSDAVKEGAVIYEHIKEIEVKCLPKDLVDSFKVDLSALKDIGNSIRVSDLDIDFSIYNVLTNSNQVVVSASRPAKVEVEVQAQETEPAVETK